MSVGVLSYEGEVITALNYMEEGERQETIDMRPGERIYAVEVAVNEDQVVKMAFLIAKDTMKAKRSFSAFNAKTSVYWKPINRRCNV